MKIPDASYEFNERYDLNRYSHMPGGTNPWAKPYWFRKEFDVPADYSGKTIWVVKLMTTIQPDGFSGDTVKVNSSVTLKANSRREVILEPKDHPQLVLKNPRLVAGYLRRAASVEHY